MTNEQKNQVAAMNASGMSIDEIVLDTKLKPLVHRKSEEGVGKDSAVRVDTFRHCYRAVTDYVKVKLEAGSSLVIVS